MCAHSGNGIDREAVAVLQLIDSVAKYLREYLKIRWYPHGSRLLLENLEALSQASMRFIQEDTFRAKWTTPEIARTNLRLLRRDWVTLHNVVKPLADAHTLRVPSPLIRLVELQVAKMPDLQKAHVAVELAADLNYLQRPHTPVLKAARAVIQLVHDHDPKKLSDTFAIIGLPYSLGTDLFANCLLYHELAHFILEERGLLGLIQRKTRQYLITKIPGLEKEESRHLLSLVRVFSAWWEEICADLVAVRLAGPVYTFVMRDVLEMLGYSDPSVAVYPSETHPPPAARFREQVILLDTLGWIKLLEKTGYSSALEEIRIAAKPINEPDSAKATLPCTRQIADPDSPEEQRSLLRDLFESNYPDLAQQVQNQAADITGDGGRPDPDFENHQPRITRCLSHAVVPFFAHVNTMSDPSQVTTIINVAYLFKKHQISLLEEHIKNFDSSDISVAAKLAKRIDEWTLKALEFILPTEQPA